ISPPIIGDSRHGKGPLNRACEAYFGVGRLWLHCQSIELQGRDGVRLRLQAELAAEFERLLARLADFSV
ncbi:MAG: pseudouridine synthase, partial [Gammaproteobacteria bacterium]|nr:pseudouridine synthase [Gammaproteobacteria bacterium]